MKTISNEEILDKFIGKKGTSDREAFDNRLTIDLLVSKFIELRMKKDLSRKQLAKKVGMKKEEISKLEKGALNLTIDNGSKIANALGFNLSQLQRSVLSENADKRRPDTHLCFQNTR